MRIVIDSFTVSKGGGVAVHIINLLNNFSERNEIIVLIKRDEDSSLFNAKKNVSFKKMPFYNKFTRLLYEQILIPLYAFYIKADAIYLPKQYAPILRTAKIVTTVHDFIPDKKSGGESLCARIYWKLQYNLIKMKSDNLIFYTKEAALKYKKRFRNLSKKRYAIIQNGFDSYSRRENQKQKYILIPSTLKKRKNIETAVELGLMIRKNFPDKTIAVIGRTDLKVIEKRIKEKNENVEFLGFVSRDKAEELFNDSFAVLYLSSDEGFGLPIAEAISLDKMVVAADNKLNKSIYKDMPIYYNLQKTVEENADSIIEKLKKGAHYEEKKRTWSQAGKETELFLESIL